MKLGQVLEKTIKDFRKGINMNRRDFIKFLGVSTAATTATTALAALPEVEPKIILLDKPKKIIEIGKDLPDVDFYIEHLISVNYSNHENVSVNQTIGNYEQIMSYGTLDIKVEAEFELWAEDSFNLFSKFKENRPRTFAFNLDYALMDTSYYKLLALNGRKFMVSEYNIVSSHDNKFIIGNIEGYEIIN